MNIFTSFPHINTEVIQLRWKFAWYYVLQLFLENTRPCLWTSDGWAVCWKWKLVEYHTFALVIISETFLTWGAIAHMIYATFQCPNMFRKVCWLFASAWGWWCESRVSCQPIEAIFIEAIFVSQQAPIFVRIDIVFIQVYLSTSRGCQLVGDVYSSCKDALWLSRLCK